MDAVKFNKLLSIQWYLSLDPLSAVKRLWQPQ
jgi:hypothetical protein